MSSDREAQKAEFLAAHGLGGVRRELLAGDASTRRYERLHPLGRASQVRPDRKERLDAGRVGTEVTGRVDLEREIQSGCRPAIHRRRHPLECVAQLLANKNR